MSAASNMPFDRAEHDFKQHLAELEQPPVVLVIDDQITAFGAILDYLTDYGFDILVAQDGERGLERARYTQPDLILLDVRMPGLDGFETCRRLKMDDRTRQIPVIFLTSLAEIEDKVTGFEVGGVDYITKPFQIEEVLARLKTHLALRRLQQQLEQRVEARTRELRQANEQLTQEIEDRKRAEEKIQRRNRELALLNQVIAASVIETEVEAILEITCRELATTFDVPQAAAALLNAEKTEAVVVAEYLEGDRPAAMGQVIPAEDNPSFQYLINHKSPLVVDDAQNDPRLAAIHNLVRQRGIVSLLLIPLLIKGEVVGSLGLDAVEPRRFSVEEVSLAWSVADQVSGVLARLRLDQERQRLEAQYYQAQKMDALGQLTGGVAHDFNNILTVILGNCGFISNALSQNHPLQQDVDQIQKAAERASALTRQMLAFSRQQDLRPTLLSLNDTVTNIEKLLRRLIGENIDLITKLEPQLEPVKADPGQLEQVIMNLVINARDAMPTGGKLTIETANIHIDDNYAQTHPEMPSGPCVMLAVTDTGHGIDKTTQPHIFEPFFTTKAPGEGTGLGLATVYGIIKQSGGNVMVYSEPGLGATFKVYLPTGKTTFKSQATPQPQFEAQGGSETILLAEDEEAVRRLIRFGLQDKGYTVLEAGSGSEALSLARQYEGQISLLITDVVMRSMNGRELAEQIKQLYPQIKVLFMSGYTDDAVVRHGVLTAEIEFLSKPFSQEELAYRVRQMLDK